MNEDFTVKVLFDAASHYKTYHNVRDVYTKDRLLCIRFRHNHDDVDDVVHKYPLDKIFRIEHEYNADVDGEQPIYSIAPPIYGITPYGTDDSQSYKIYKGKET